MIESRDGESSLYEEVGSYTDRGQKWIIWKLKETPTIMRDTGKTIPIQPLTITYDRLPKNG